MAVKEQEYYAKSTSDRSEKLIIDLFNRLNKDEGFRMKTITTIYKENDIFKGNARYPIDAPFQPFYVELTEKYILKYKLDDLFFENHNIKTGEFYFEFSYNELNNKITISEYPKSSIIEKDKVRSYVPMLYSMISGRKINWEEARDKLVFEKDTTKNKFNVLVVFGEDQMKTLQFSWLSVFEIGNQLDVKLVSDKIRDQEEIIINSIQGVLFSELETVFIDYLDARSKLHYSEWVKADYRHTIRNLGVKGAFFTLYQKIKDNQELLPFFDRLEDLYIVQEYATDILYSNGSMLDENGINTYTAILELLHSSSVYRSKKIINYPEEIKDGFLNKIRSEDLPNVFTILFNLYSNTLKHGKGDYSISLNSDEKNNLIIKFDNKNLIPKKYRQFLAGKKKKVKGEGLSYIKLALLSLEGKVEIDFLDSIDRTIIILKVLDYEFN